MTSFVEPEVRVIARPSLDVSQVREYLDEVGGSSWLERVEPIFQEGFLTEAEGLVEFAGRLCYRSWEPGLNPNVTKVREDSSDYLNNIVSSLHGSVTEHSFFVFLFSNVSRVFTHELVRHRVGTSISQESFRYVRLDKIPFWMPTWATEDEELVRRCEEVLDNLESFQLWMSEHFALDESKDFSYKKHRTSFMRRFAPEGVATSLVWGANIRTLRHVIEMRTALSAEEEIRIVFDKVANLIVAESPNLMADMVRNADGEWISKYRKI